MDIRIVTVTYNSEACITDCIESVLGQRGVGCEMVVIDNQSGDETLRRVGNFGNRVRLLANQRNVGFGTACNQGAAGARSRFIHFLNPDASLPSELALADLIAEMEANPRWGLCGTAIAGETELPCERNYPGQRHLKHALPRLPGEIAWTVGASLFFRRELFEQIGGFDERIFLYAEEIDICLRTRKAGFEIGMVPSVAINHIGGVSERSFTSESTWRRKLEGLSRFYRNHYDTEDVGRLWRRDLARARWRLFWNRITGSRNPEKLAKYAALQKVALEQMKHSC